MGIEFELKYRATAAQQEQLLARYGGNHHTITMETVYYDTPDRFLSHKRITLRRRMENGVAVCTVKTPAEQGCRGEWECRCDDICASVYELCKLGAPEFLLLLAIAKLEPICGARFTRQAMDIRTAEFTAELALDRGILTGGGREEAMCEVELELKSGDGEAMTAYMETLAAEYGLEPENRSKFRRAKALADNHK